MPAKSKNQQEFFGLALSVKRGETPRSEVSDEVLRVVDDMSEKDIEDFAGTKHKGLPNKVKQEEAMLAKLFHEVREEVRSQMKETNVDFGMMLSEIKNEVSKQLNEAEEVEYSSLDSKEQKVIQALGKVLDVDRTPTAIFKGIHGTVVQFEINKGVGGYRYDIKELKTLSRLPIRWIDNDRSSISVGF